MNPNHARGSRDARSLPRRRRARRASRVDSGTSISTTRCASVSAIATKSRNGSTTTCLRESGAA